MESLWIRGIIPGICDTLSDAYSQEARSPLLSSAGFRSGFKEAAGWPEGSHEALRMTALGNWPYLLLLALGACFQPLSLLGQRVFSVG